ncbi:uncharacterized protein LOC115586232 isoform X2 [Sparus aurata]|uniref:uncharacterized protein LOC115586232 isoform X2 n=1 Tax=Sparus aurata TaxID=8175 RepID=UPI0011C18BF2|nr:uncharacterized protein LOC115586232 isoform X2 [Sparus aurata]
MSASNPGGAVLRQTAQWPALSSEVLPFLLQLSSLALFSPLFLSSSAFLFFFCSSFSFSSASSLSRCSTYSSLVITLACRGNRRRTPPGFGPNVGVGTQMVEWTMQQPVDRWRSTQQLVEWRRSTQQLVEWRRSTQQLVEWRRSTQRRRRGWMPAFLKPAMMFAGVTAFSWACLRTEENCFLPITMSPLTRPMRLARVLNTAFSGLKMLMSSGWSM